MLTIVKATAQHCIDLAPNLREMDKMEGDALMPKLPHAARLVLSLETSDTCSAVVDDTHGTVAIFGLRNLWGETGVPWMMASDRFFELHTRQFVKECRYHFAEMKQGYRLLYNYIAVKNTKCHRWLSWLGFEIHLNEQTEINGVMFCPFSYRGSNNV